MVRWLLSCCVPGRAS